jgi:hypothetical protein
MASRNGVNQWSILIIFLSLLLLLSCATISQESAPLDSLPRFSNCDYATDNHIELDKCARKSMYLFIEKELQEFSKEYTLSKFTEEFIVSFHVETNGEIKNIEIHNEADKLAKNIMTKIFNSMDRWVPAKNKYGQNARVRIAIPVKIISGRLIKT